MSDVTTGANDQDVIAKVIQHYIDGARSGKGDDMKPAFHEDATVFGYVGPDLFAGPIRKIDRWQRKFCRYLRRCHLSIFQRGQSECVSEGP